MKHRYGVPRIANARVRKALPDSRCPTGWSNAISGCRSKIVNGRSVGTESGPSSIQEQAQQRGAESATHRQRPWTGLDPPPSQARTGA